MMTIQLALPTARRTTASAPTLRHRLALQSYYMRNLWPSFVATDLLSVLASVKRPDAA
jgi:hypothetical protein